MDNTSVPRTDLRAIDVEITRRASPAGTAQPAIVKDLQVQWSPSSIRQRIDLLAARGIIRTERRDGRIFVYPMEIPA